MRSFQLGVIFPAQPSTSKLPDTYYQSFSQNVEIPGGKIILAAQPDGTGKMAVDDKAEILVNGETVFSHDFSDGNRGIFPIGPQDLTKSFVKFVGQKVDITFKYIDLHPGSHGSGVNFWLCLMD